MPMRVVVSFPAQSGLPEDEMKNVWHFSGLEGSFGEGDFEAVKAAVDSFYTDDPDTGSGGVLAPMGFMADGALGAAAPTVDIYDVDLATGLSGSPAYSSSLVGFVPGTFAALPTEVAVCLSFNGDTSTVPEESGSTRPRARRRGRIFLPALGTNAIDAAGTGPQVHPNLREALADAAVLLATNPLILSRNLFWCVYSRTAGVVHPVEGGFVDNEFDTQRRRGRKSTARTIWSA